MTKRIYSNIIAESVEKNQSKIFMLNNYCNGIGYSSSYELS